MKYKSYFTIRLDNPSAIKGSIESWIREARRHVAQLRKRQDIHLPQFGVTDDGGSDFLSAIYTFTIHYPQLVFTMCHVHQDNTKLQIYTIQADHVLYESFHEVGEVKHGSNRFPGIVPASLIAHDCINGVFTQGQHIDMCDRIQLAEMFPTNIMCSINCLRQSACGRLAAQ